MDLSRALLFGLGSGVAGWVLENLTSEEPRYSKVFGDGTRIPFLPIYAVGGALVAATAPEIRALTVPARALVYGGGLTALEALAGRTERALGRRSWDYRGDVVDLPHAALWSILGLGLEAIVLRSEP